MVKRALLPLGGLTVAAICSLVVAGPSLARSAGVSHTLQVKFESIDAPVEKTSATWTSALSTLPSSPSSSVLDKALSKVSPAYDSALKTFDGALAALHLPGSAGTDATAIITEDKIFEGLLGSAAHVSTGQFEATFRAVFSKDMTLAAEFKGAMGLQADVSMVV
jgi:hypothetical protein